MPSVYEIFGFPVEDKSIASVTSRKDAWCPFMDAPCDGGGNRYMAEIDLSSSPLKALYPQRKTVPVGVCSLSLSRGATPWIICPRRLFYMGNSAGRELMPGGTQKVLLDFCSFPSHSMIGVWAEIKARYSEARGSKAVFDYTFDYVLIPLGARSVDEAASISGLGAKKISNYLDEGHTLANFPIGQPVIVEVMTSSTSGGNKKTRSRIPEAFEDCLLDRPHRAPSINYRQVWARMASQLIVKSQAAIAWGGKTVWILQNTLAEYISKTTGLDLGSFVSTCTDEVNILSFAYGRDLGSQSGRPRQLEKDALFSGPIGEGGVNPCFKDIVLAPVCPPKKTLIQALLKKPMANLIRLT